MVAGWEDAPGPGGDRAGREARVAGAEAAPLEQSTLAFALTEISIKSFAGRAGREARVPVRVPGKAGAAAARRDARRQALLRPRPPPFPPAGLARRPYPALLGPGEARLSSGGARRMTRTAARHPRGPGGPGGCLGRVQAGGVGPGGGPGDGIRTTRTGG